jgi:hypothetical protein
MAKLFTLLLAAVVVLSLLVSPIACTRKLSKPKHKAKPKPVSHRTPAPAAKPKPNPVSYKPAAPAVAKPPRSNHTTKHSPSIVYGGAWLSGAGATYYGAPNGDGSDGQYLPSRFIISSLSVG